MSAYRRTLPISTALGLLAVVLLILLNGFFVAAEFALVAVDWRRPSRPHGIHERIDLGRQGIGPVVSVLLHEHAARRIRRAAKAAQARCLEIGR